MGNYIVGHVLISEAPNRNNRGEDGSIKSIWVGNAERKRESSPALKYAIRRRADIGEIRSSDIEEFVNCYLEELNDPELNEAETYAVGEMICIKGFGNKFWKKLKKGTTKAEDPDSDSSKKEEDSGRTVVVTNSAQLYAIVEAGVQAFKSFRAEKEKGGEIHIFNAVVQENPEPVDEEGKKISAASIKKMKGKFADAMEAAMKKASAQTAVTASEAMGGKMAASGVTGTVYAAASVAEVYSIDPLRKTFNTFTAKGVVSEMGDPNSDDPKSRALARFAKIINNKKGSDHLNTNELASNTMYRYMSIDVPCLYRGLDQNLPYEGDKKDKIASDEVVAWFDGVLFANPVGGSTSSNSCTRPGIAYIEVISHGSEYQMQWNKAITPADGDIMEVGVQHMLDELSDTAFDGNDDVRRYVLLRYDMKKKFAEAFEAAGVKVLDDIHELRKIIAEETVKISKW